MSRNLELEVGGWVYDVGGLAGPGYDDCDDFNDFNAWLGLARDELSLVLLIFSMDFFTSA